QGTYRLPTTGDDADLVDAWFALAVLDKKTADPERSALPLAGSTGADGVGRLADLGARFAVGQRGLPGCGLLLLLVATACSVPWRYAHAPHSELAPCR
ncbi:hypothetical protein, partial [Streptomyces sp. NPDC006999]|uniref:hypothetical protein n=1 Tax=Streptomyces sp. NPDC006999 TaxID=3156909 RepID=UPI00340CA6C5